MKKHCINVIIALGGGVILFQVQRWLNSSYLSDFLKADLITLLVALLAINTTSQSLLVTKLRELMDQAGVKDGFPKTRASMLRTIQEQVYLVALSLLLLMALDSAFILRTPKLPGIVEVLLIACFVHAVHILYDTARSVFLILDFKSEEHK